MDRPRKGTIFVLLGLGLLIWPACRDKEGASNQGLWRNSGGQLIQPTDLASLASGPFLSAEEDHLVVPLHSASACGSTWVTDDCAPWATAALFRCTRDWLLTLKTGVSVEGTVRGGMSRRIVVFDANGSAHRSTVSPRDGSFRVHLAKGESPVVIKLAPFESALEEVSLLWLFARRINFRAMGLVMQQAGPTWFARALEKGSSSSLSDLELGDTIVSLNGRSLEGGGFDRVGNALEMDRHQTRVEYARCGRKGIVNLTRLPLGVVWSLGGECPCAGDRCPPERDRTEQNVAAAPRDCPS